MYSIRGQIIMSHYFHIKKKSIISIVLVKFLTIVRWMYKIPSERCHKNTNTTHQRVRDMRFTAESSFASSRQRNSLNLHTQSLGDQWLQSALASIFPLRWVVCCVFKDCQFYVINILNQRFYLATLARFYLSSTTFNTYIQYNMELRYILLNTGKDQKDNAWVVRHARLIWITRDRELRKQISGLCWIVISSHLLYHQRQRPVVCKKKSYAGPHVNI